MEEEVGEEPGRVRSTAPKDFHYYRMDLYDAEDRPSIFPDEKARLRRETVQAEMTVEPRQEGQSQVQRDLPEEVDELVHLYGLEDDHELGDEFVDEDEVEVPVYPLYGMKRGEPAREQRDWRLGGEAEAEDQGYAGWGMAGQSQALREAYRYTHGCASEDYECYVIPEEEDEEEAAGLFCVTCRTPVRACYIQLPCRCSSCSNQCGKCPNSSILSLQLLAGLPWKVSEDNFQSQM